MTLLFIVVAVIIVSGCTSQEPVTQTPTPDQTAQPNTQQEATQPETPTELELNIGETATTSKLEVTVFSAEKNTFYEYYSDIFQETMTQDAKQGKTFILVDAEIKNVGSDSALVGVSDFSMTDSEGYSYDVEALYLGDDGLDLFKELYQNQKIRGKILFEVPDDAEGLKLLYDFGNMFIGNQLVSWNLE